MSAEAETPQPRLSGDAAWRAHLNATEQRNAATKRIASDHRSPTERALVQRERRLAQAEVKNLEALNKQIAARDRAS